MKFLLGTVTALSLVLVVAAGMLFLYPRPADTTDVAIFSADGAQVDYCHLPRLDGSGILATDIPRAYTPGCGWARWPLPILAACREPLAPGVQDIRGLWRSITPHSEHIERIEQCGNRTVITSAGIIHDFYTDGTLTNGSRDIEPPLCINTWAAIEWRDGILNFRPFGGPVVAVTRRLEGDELVWHYPGKGDIRMERVCRIM